MKLKDTIDYCSNIKLYKKGSAVMWTDEHISKQLLKAHLDPNTDAGSRNKNKIEKLCRWIQKSFGEGRKKLLDLGCGPGLYTEWFAKLGFNVSGVDFSQSSIDYAVKNAGTKGRDINYRCMDYFKLEAENEVDIITMIYCDFCVLSGIEQSDLLNSIRHMLRPGGVFIFDVYNEGIMKVKNEDRTWECASGGFWRKKEYINLAISRHYPQNRVVLDQNVIIDEKGFEVYRFWSRWFEEKEIITLLKKHGFCKVQSCDNMLRAKSDPVEEMINIFAAYK